MGRLLTPKDVRDHKFTFHWLGGGYDEAEVNEFMDEVEDTVRSLGSAGLALLRLINERRPRSNAYSHD